MKRLTLFSFLFALYAISVDAQSLKTYSGELRGGTMTYTYYEDETTGAEKRHGSFKYVKTEANDISQYNLIITGQYSHGYMNGLWSYTIRTTDYPEGSAYVTGTTNARMSFKEGMPDGPWTYSYAGKGRLKRFSLTGWYWSAYETLPTETASVTFRNGTLVGTMNVKTSADNITGRLNDDGFWIGNWVIINGDSRSEYTLRDDGLMTKGVGRYNGRIVSSAGLEPELKMLFDEYKTLPTAEQREKFCRKHRIKIDTTQCTYPTLFDREFGFIYDYASEDKTYRDEEGHRVDRKNYGRYIQIKRIEPVAFSELFSGSFTDISSFEERLGTYGWQLNEEDWQKAQNILTQWKAYDALAGQIEDVRSRFSINITDLAAQDGSPCRFSDTRLLSALNDYTFHATYQWAYALQQASNGVFQVEKDLTNSGRKYARYIVQDFDRDATGYTSIESNVKGWIADFEPQYKSFIDSLCLVGTRASTVSDKIAQLDMEAKEAARNQHSIPNIHLLFVKYTDVVQYLCDAIGGAPDLSTVTGLVEQINRVCSKMQDKTGRATIRKALRKNNEASIETLVTIMSE